MKEVELEYNGRRAAEILRENVVLDTTLAEPRNRWTGFEPGRHETRKDVMHFLDKNKERVRYVNLLFPDVLGNLLGFEIPVDKVEQAIDEGIDPRKHGGARSVYGKGFDGSSIEGYVRIEESDLVARADPGSLWLPPWRFLNTNGDDWQVAPAMYCDITDSSGNLHLADNRHLVRRLMEKVKEQGFDHFYVGPEMEFFYFDFDDAGRPSTTVLDEGGYFSMGAQDPLSFLRFMTQEAVASAAGITANYGHHEVAPSQHEIDFDHMDALQMADAMMTYRYVNKMVALLRAGVHSTFMPKPLNGVNGSGMHIHHSLTKMEDGEEKNVFFDSGGKHFLSEEAEKFLGGELSSIDGILLGLCQHVNSYKRLQPGFEAPVRKVVGNKNRSCLIRIPDYERGNPMAVRGELRVPDPSVNPYIALALLGHAGLDGIASDEQGEIKFFDSNVYDLAEDEVEKLGRLPTTLEEAIGAFRDSDVARDALGEHVFESLLRNKEAEWEEYQEWLKSGEGQVWKEETAPGIAKSMGIDAEKHDLEKILVTPWEVRRNLPVL